MSYRLTPRCEQDIADFHLRGAQLFGLAHADRYQDGLRATFELFAAHPRIARERNIKKQTIRLHPYQAHLIFYREDSDGILVVRVLHARRDWLRHLAGR